VTRVGVLGGGAFGTALALLCHSRGYRVRVWTHEVDLPARIREEKENAPYLPGVPIPEAIEFHHDLAWALEEADLVLVVAPAQHVRSVAERARPHLPPGAFIGCCTKGIEHGSLELMSEVLAEVLPDSVRRHAFLSGPTFAKELARGLPMDIAVASSDIETAHAVQAILHAPSFRVYAGNDPIGVEMAGSLKNVIAIACGTADELGLGLSARASLISRGLAEITRMGVARGAHPVTFLGLAGVGDLILTCTGELSRNHTLGRLVARGGKAREIVASQNAVAEGYFTAEPAHQLAKKLGVDAPLLEQVYYVLYQDRSIGDAMELLMNREPKPEFLGIL